VHGTTAVIGAHNDDKDEDGMGFMYHAGSAYIFDRQIDGTWTQTQKIVASDRSPGFEYEPDHEDWNDRFGESVGIWNDYIAVGGPFASKAYAFEKVGDTWTEVAFLTFPGISWLDRAAPISIDSNIIALGASTEDLNADGEESIMNSGGAAVYKRTGGSWTYLQKLSPADRDAGDHFGISISVDGGYIVVGTHSDNHDEFDDDEIENTGSLYVFEMQDDGFFEEIKKLDASDREEDDELGISVAISGINIIAGAFQQDQTPGGGDYLEDAGGAYFYSTAPDGGGGDCETIFHTQEVEICSGSVIVVGDSEYNEEGVYTDELVTEDGCDSVVTTILEVADPISFEQEFFLCFGESVTVGESTYNETGFYTDEFTVDGECDSLVYTFVVVDEPINTTVEADGVTLEAVETGVDYQWVKCDPFEVIDGATDQTYVAEENGSYAVIIDNGDCSDTSECVAVNTIGLFENQLDHLITIYPNPSNGEFMVNGEDLIGAELKIFSTIGELVYEKTVNSDQFLIDLSNHAAGIYILEITSDLGTKTVKLKRQ